MKPEEVLNKIAELESEGKKIAAIDMLYDYATLLDSEDEEFERQKGLLLAADVKKLSITMMIGLLTVSSANCDRMPYRKEFFNAVRDEIILREGGVERGLLTGLDCPDDGAGAKWGNRIIRKVLDI
jgi:hypothetical protein